MHGSAAGGYPAPMFGEFISVQRMPLTLVTDRLIIQGTVLMRIRRLIDLLNEPDARHIVLQDATFMEVGSRRVVASAAAAQVQLADILFAHSSGPVDSASTMRMPKQPVKATLLLPPYTVEGQIHLPYETELRVALEAYEDRFVPVTTARYWAYSVTELPVSVDLLAVNHDRAHVSIAAGVHWGGETGPAESEGSQNPW